MWAAGAAVATLAVLMVTQAARSLPVPAQNQDTEWPADGRTQAKRLRWSGDARDAALRRAAVWRAPLAEAGRLAAEPADASGLTCRFESESQGGTTPKFECVTHAGDTIKVKYAGAEPHGEVAASRLLRRVGFAADDVSFVERVRCYGCPAFPFLTMKVLGFIKAADAYRRAVNYDQYRDFAWPAVERRHPGAAIDTADVRGWAWYELPQLEAPVAHVDALRLMAMLLAHWDNKAENQRLVCLDRDVSPRAEERCAEPLVLVQDLGATFGPRKVNLSRWRRTPIWTDRDACLVSMARLPHGGGTFHPVRISEAGRQFLAAKLAALTRNDIRALFERARFPQHDGRNVDEWVNAFDEKVREIIAGPPCPAR